MQSSPYRSTALVLPKQHVSCTDESPCRCHLARPREHRLFGHSWWRVVVLPATVLFAVFGGTMIAAAAALPQGGVDTTVRPARPKAIPLRARTPTTGSLLLGVVHDPDALFSYAQAAKREGVDVTLVDAWVTPQPMTTFDDALGLSKRDVVLSVDGHPYSSMWMDDVAYRRHIVELRRDGKLVVISVRKGG